MPLRSSESGAIPAVHNLLKPRFGFGGDAMVMESGWIYTRPRNWMPRWLRTELGGGAQEWMLNNL
jgi:hypothetical protein